MSERTPGMTPTPRPRKPWYRTRNLVLGLLLTAGPVLAWAGRWALIATPASGIETDAAYYAIKADLVIPDREDRNALPIVIEAGDRLDAIASKAIRDYYNAQGQSANDPEAWHPKDTLNDRRGLLGLLTEHGAPPEALTTARAALAAADAAGLPALLEEIASSSRYDRIGMVTWRVTLDDLAVIRDLLTYSMSRLLVAAESGDWGTVLDTARETMALSELVRREPFWFYTLNANAHESRLMETHAIALAEHPITPDLIDEIERATRPRPDRPDIGSEVERFRFNVRMNLDFFFTDAPDGNGRLLLDRYLAWNGTFTGPPGTNPAPARLINLAGFLMPRRNAVMQTVDRIASEFAQLAGESADRAVTQAEWDRLFKGFEDLPYLQFMGYELRILSNRPDRYQRFRRREAGFRAMLAVERFRAVHGRPPASLDELARPDLTIDPSGEWTLRYVTPVPQARVVPGQPRDYILLCHPAGLDRNAEDWLGGDDSAIPEGDGWLANSTRKAWKP